VARYAETGPKALSPVPTTLTWGNSRAVGADWSWAAAAPARSITATPGNVWGTLIMAFVGGRVGNSSWAEHDKGTLLIMRVNRN
jgi:hypothetical protein